MQFDFEYAFQPGKHTRGSGRTCTMIAFAVHCIDLYGTNGVVVYASHDIRGDVESALVRLGITFTRQPVKQQSIWIYECMTVDGEIARLEVRRRSQLRNRDVDTLRGRRPAILIDHSLWEYSQIDVWFQEFYYHSGFERGWHSV